MEKKLIYQNDLGTQADVSDFIFEGEPKLSFDGGLILAGGVDESLGDHAHFLLWIPQKFPENILLTYQFTPLSEEGLCMVFFSADGQNGKDLFDQSLSVRDGYYPQYHSGQINAYHISYYRRKFAEERAFQTCNLRKSSGFHLVAQGADPLPGLSDICEEGYQISIKKFNHKISFYINHLLLFEWQDEGKEGACLGSGYIGLRQMTPMKGKYSHLKVFELAGE